MALQNSPTISTVELPSETMASVVFPADIISEILSRLPVKPLLRFRCVSKPWCSLIDSEEFVKKHLKQSVVTKTNLNLILGFRKSISSISLDSVHLNGVVSLDTVESLAPPPFSEFVMLNSCNGLSLVLMKESKVSQLCIWNPFTRKYRKLPVTSIEYPVGIETNSLIANERYAFAYVSETGEYKVVRVVEFTRFDGSWEGSWLGSTAKIFSSTSNKWEKIEDFPYKLSYKRVWGAHLDGVLHNVVKTGSSSWSIMRFDVRSKQHARVPNPDLGISEILGMTVEVLGGCLSLINQDLNHPKADVWVMKEYGVKDSWFKLLSVDLKSFEFSYGSLRYTVQPLDYSKNGDEVLMNEIDERLYWYNLRTRTSREITVNVASEFYTELCFESLVSFPGFISVGNVKEKSEKKDNKEKKSNVKKDRKKKSNNSWGFSLGKDFKLVL